MHMSVMFQMLLMEKFEGPAIEFHWSCAFLLYLSGDVIYRRSVQVGSDYPDLLTGVVILDQTRLGF